MKEDTQKIDAAYGLYRKYNDLPRAGWVEPGSRDKANHAILVSRAEVVTMASDLHSALYAQSVFAYELENLRHYLETLAKGEHDAVKCGKCHGVYRRGWLKGKCIYCEAEAAAQSMIRGTEPGGEG